MRRIFTIILTAILIMALLSSCDLINISGIEEDVHAPQPTLPSDSPSPEFTTPPPIDLLLPIVTDGSITLKIWYPLPVEVLEHTSNLADGSNYAWTEAIKRTGIKIEFTHPNEYNETELFQIMVATADYPDIYKGISDIYQGGPDKAVRDEVWLRLNELLENYAPNYMSLVNRSDTSRKNSITDDGNMVCISQVYDRRQPAFAGYAIRQDWLDDLNLQRPETYDDWHNVLTQFKENKTANGAGPLELSSTGIPISNAFSGGYGVHSDFFIQKDGKIIFSQAEPGFREYLEMMSTWYNEGLIDKDFITNGGTGLYPNINRMISNQSGAVAMMYTYAGDYISRAGFAEQGAIFTLTKWPVKEAGTHPPVAMKGKEDDTLLGDLGAMIFTSCKYPVHAIRFIDYFYSEEGALLANYGIEGITFTYADGKPLLTELITNNPDGLSTTIAQTRHLIHNGFVLFILDREEDVQNPEALEYRELWSPTGEWNIQANLTYTPEEGAERSNFFSDIKTYVSEMTIRFIMGAEQLNDTSWNKFIEQMHSLNIDRVTEITQSAYDRYQKR